MLTLGRTRGRGGGGGSGGGGEALDATTHRMFLNFIKRILSGHLSISVAVRLSLRHIYCEFGENWHIHTGDIKR